MKASEKKLLKEALSKLAELSSILQSRYDEYEDNDKENTPTAEKCSEELEAINYAGQDLADILELDFETDFVEQ